MILYTVRYRLLGTRRWETLRNVKADGFVWTGVRPSDRDGGVPATRIFAVRWFILEDETRVEVPSEAATFVFSPERLARDLEARGKQIGKKLDVDPE